MDDSGDDRGNAPRGEGVLIFASSIPGIPMRSYGEFQCPEAAVYSIVRFPGIIPRKLGFGEVVVMQGVIRYFGAGGLTTTPTTKTCRWVSRGLGNWE